MVHGGLLAAAFAVLGRSFALPSGLAAGVVAAVLAAPTAAALRRGRVRLWAALGLGATIGGGAQVLAGVLLQSSLTADLLGIRGALNLAEALRVGGGVFALVLAVRSLSLRFRPALLLEAGLIVAAVAAPVAAHRDGMIARPLEIADWFWEQGLDPVLAFLALGGLGALLAAGTLSREARPLRRLIQLLAVALLAVLVAVPLHRRSSDSLLREPEGGGLGEAERRAKGSRGGQADGRPATSEDQLDKDGPAGERGQQRPVAVVVFHKDAEPLGGVFYFRHAAFSQFNGSRLVESVSEVDADVPWRFPTHRQPVAGPGEGSFGREMVATDVALISEHRRLFALTDPVELEPMPNPAPARFKRAYRVVSNVVTASAEKLLGRASGDPAWSPERWAHYTALPEDARYLEMAARIDETVPDSLRGDPFAQAFAVKRHLERTTIYSFKPKYEGSDPTADFLFVDGDRKGYCTHIAHSAALLLRAMGLPTRVGAGYGVMASNLRGGSALLVKSGDAHAWVELYLEGVGWVPVEITPERTEFEPPPFEEEDLQRLLGEMARGEGRETFAPVGPSPLWAWLALVRRALPWIVAGLIVLAYLVKGLRLMRPSWSPERVGPAYRAALDRLAAVGVVRGDGESRVAFARRADRMAPSFSPLTLLLERSILAGHPGGRAPGGRTAAALAGAVRGELGQNLPTWRRVLAWLHPIPWWWAR